MYKGLHNRKQNLVESAIKNDIYIKPDANLSSLIDKLLYYPFSGRDWDLPILLFRDFVNEFWFVDSGYSFLAQDLKNYSTSIFQTMKLIDTSFIGVREGNQEETRYTEKGEKYKYLHPGMMTQIYHYQDQEININFRRGYDYTSLFGPSELDIAESRIGVFFLRGTTPEGGSNHPWFNSTPVKILKGKERVSLSEKLIQALPDSGLIVTDGSLTKFGSPKNVYHQMSPFFCNIEIPLIEAMKKANPFYDHHGNFFTCIGYAGKKNGPTLIWLVEKGKT